MTRRSPGEGGLSKRSDGRWQASWTANGKRRYVYAPTRRAASERLAIALRDLEHGLIGPDPKVADYLARWLEQTEVRPITRTRYESLIRLHAIPNLGALPLSKVRPDHLADLFTSLRSSQSAASIGQLRTVLNAAFRQALEWNLVVRNPVTATKAPRVERREMAVLDRPAIRALRAAIVGDELEALYVLALATGARQGELLALRWCDVAPAAITISATLTLGQRMPPKTTSSVRTIPIGDEAQSALRAHRLRMAERLLPFRARPEGDTLVFLTELGEPYNGSHVTERMFKPLLRRHGLREIRFHDLRHACASFHLGIGTPVHVVSEMLGHSSPAVTLGIYAHVIPGDQEDAAARLDAVLGA